MSWSAMKSSAMADAKERIAKGQAMAEEGEAMTTNPQTPEDYEQGQRMQAEAAGISAEGQATASSVEQWQNDGHLPSVEGGGMFDQMGKGFTQRMDDMTRTAIDTHGVKDQAEAQYLEQNPHAELNPDDEQPEQAQGDFYTPETDPEPQLEDDSNTIEGTAENITDQQAIEQSPPEEEPEQSM